MQCCESPLGTGSTAWHAVVVPSVAEAAAPVALPAAMLRGKEGNSGGHTSRACTAILYTKCIKNIYKGVMRPIHAESFDVTDGLRQAVLQLYVKASCAASMHCWTRRDLPRPPFFWKSSATLARLSKPQTYFKKYPRGNGATCSHTHHTTLSLLRGAVTRSCRPPWCPYVRTVCGTPPWLVAPGYWGPSQTS
jgi:hypothetical protein